MLVRFNWKMCNITGAQRRALIVQSIFDWKCEMKGQINIIEMWRMTYRVSLQWWDYESWTIWCRVVDLKKREFPMRLNRLPCKCCGIRSCLVGLIEEETQGCTKNGIFHLWNYPFLSTLFTNLKRRLGKTFIYKCCLPTGTSNWPE